MLISFRGVVRHIFLGLRPEPGKLCPLVSSFNVKLTVFV